MNKPLDKHNRIVWVDYLRCIGLLLVVAAHVFGTSSPILQLLFGCNVAIMVVVSGYCSVRSSECSIIEYYTKRGRQMIIRPWVFFIVYFLLIGLLNIGKQYPYSYLQVIKTFLFMDGIGYTWIICVFVVTAISTPIYSLILDKTPRIKLVFPIMYWILASVLFVIPVDFSIVKILLYVVGYVFLSFIGFVICIDRHLINKYLATGVIVICFCLTIIIKQHGDVFDLSSNKYPPTVYYITYGMIVSLILVKVLERFENKFRSLNVSKAIIVMSKHSFDIYLWHVFGLYVSSSIKNDWLRFFVVLIVSIFCATAYNKIIKVIKRK